MVLLRDWQDDISALVGGVSGRPHPPQALAQAVDPGQAGSPLWPPGICQAASPQLVTLTAALWRIAYLNTCLLSLSLVPVLNPSPTPAKKRSYPRFDPVSLTLS